MTRLCYPDPFPMRMTGGDGSGPDEAIVVEAPSSAVASLMEHYFIGMLALGREQPLVGQSLQTRGDRHYDVLVIRNAQGEHEIWFDITNPFTSQQGQGGGLDAMLKVQIEQRRSASLALGLQGVQFANACMSTTDGQPPQQLLLPMVSLEHATRMLWRGLPQEWVSIQVQPLIESIIPTWVKVVHRLDHLT